MTGWRAVLGASGLAVLLSGCGAFGTGAAPTAQPAVVPTIAPIVARAPASPVPSAAPTQPPRSTVIPAAARNADTVLVGNTDGEGVFVRKTPVMADRVRAYVDGTPLTIVGEDVDGDGQHWKHIKTPDGLEGYVPSVYTVDTDTQP